MQSNVERSRSNLVFITSKRVQNLGNRPAGLTSRRRKNAASSYDQDTLIRYYRQIGRLLRVCEVGSFRIGVPWLPPTARVTALRTDLERQLHSSNPAQRQSIADYIRTGLVGVPTTVLEMYGEDLGGYTTEEPSESYHLALGRLSRFERYAGTLIVTTIAVTLYFAHLWFWKSTSLVVIALGVGLVAAAAVIGMVTGSEGYRRATFAWVVSAEIQRRRGSGSDRGSQLRLYTIEPKAVPK